MSMWAPFSLEAKRLLEGASRSPGGFEQTDPVALLREILSSRDPHIAALVADLGISSTGPDMDKVLNALENDRAIGPARLRKLLDAAFRRCASQGRNKADSADLLAALLNDRMIAARLRNAGLDVERVRATLS